MALTGLVLILGPGAPLPGREPPLLRQSADGLFTSSALPAIAIRPAEGFAYVGATTFDMAGEAHVDRHHFVAAGGDGEFERALILHFEGFLPESDEVYRYRIPSAENASGADFRFTREYVRLGDADYIHNTWFFSAAENIKQSPDRELARSAALLAVRGYRLPDELRMSRFVRIVGEAARHELIIFYLEPLAPTGFRAADFVKGGAGEAAFDELSAGITERSLAAFRVEPVRSTAAGEARERP